MPDEKERKIIRLEKQIEAMKMCGNCRRIALGMDGLSYCDDSFEYPIVTLTHCCPSWQLEIK